MAAGGEYFAAGESAPGKVPRERDVPTAVGSKYSRRLWRSVLPPKMSQRSPAVMVRFGRIWIGVLDEGRVIRDWRPRTKRSCVKFTDSLPGIAPHAQEERSEVTAARGRIPRLVVWVVAVLSK